ncbi:hypothetical protein PMIN06_003748 [Paraphaeosphaeria minitans]
MMANPVLVGREPDPNAAFVDTALFSVAISLPTIATTAVILRCMAKRWTGKKIFSGDDWVIVIALVFCWGHSINTFVAAGLGGINKITIGQREYANLALRTLWISNFLLVTALYTVKVSILLFYWHIFHISNQFRKACIAMIGLLSLWWISAIVVIFLIGDPIDSSWKNAALAKHRFDFNAWYLAFCGLSIVFDIAILCFPIPVIRTLKIDRRRKLSIIGIFWLGSFVCISAIVRFVLFYQSINGLSDLGKNQYSSITNAFIWSGIEPSTSVIAACLPTYGPFFRESGIVPKFIQSVKSTFGTSSASGHKTEFSTQSTSLSNGQYMELEKAKGRDRIAVETQMTISSALARDSEYEHHTISGAYSSGKIKIKV